MYFFDLPDCGRQCWCFGSNGLQALGQKELMFLLETLPDEKALPKDLFSLYLNIYQEAQKGTHTDHVLVFPFKRKTWNDYKNIIFCYREVFGGAG